MSEPTLIIFTRGRGRPTRSTTPSTKRVEFTVTATELADLKQVAADLNHGSIAGVVRQAVNEFVADYRERRVFRS